MYVYLSQIQIKCSVSGQPKPLLEKCYEFWEWVQLSGTQNLSSLIPQEIHVSRKQNQGRCFRGRGKRRLDENPQHRAGHLNLFIKVTEHTQAWIHMAWVHILAIRLACCCVPLSKLLTLPVHQPPNM